MHNKGPWETSTDKSMGDNRTSNPAYQGSVQFGTGSASLLSPNNPLIQGLWTRNSIRQARFLRLRENVSTGTASQKEIEGYTCWYI